jgi:hypothetical protein
MEIKQESFMIYQKLENEYKDYLVIIPLCAHSPVGALACCNYFFSDGGLYSKSLQKIYGEKYFYNGFEGKFHTWTKELLIEDIISKGYDKKIVLIGPAMGEYGAIYIIEGITIDAGKFHPFTFSPCER